MADEEEHPDSSGKEEESSSAGKRKRLFHKELRCMMYGFGDNQAPFTESVDLLEDLVIEYISEMTVKAMAIGKKGRVHVEDIVFLIRKDPKKYARVKTVKAMAIGKKGRVHVEDIVFLIRKDPKKYARVKDLLTMNEELKKARKAFDAESYGEIS